MQKSTDSTLERLVTDYCQVKQQNVDIEAQIQKLQNTAT